MADGGERRRRGTGGSTTVRPHSSLGYATPKEFSAACDRGKQKKVNPKS